MSARHRCSDDVHRTENVSVSFEPAGAFVFSVAGVILFSACRTGLAGVSGIDIINAYSCQGGLVCDELGQTIETPGMEVLFVFTACSCRLADASEFFKLDGFDVVFLGEINNRSGKLMVFVLHPALLFIIELP